MYRTKIDKAGIVRMRIGIEMNESKERVRIYIVDCVDGEIVTESEKLLSVGEFHELVFPILHAQKISVGAMPEGV